ncbi:hypothetical protein HPB51_008086 [Rhipicephalus microplus]|uniref:Uncharacterized protein n=1 Tax=Rhipicephalus microplus TaxID=6941 RepID=A0A9J6ENB1_RHIMP|nr:hypothetical protein HPB51_008086 [Rhipicephalus microplus]
MLVLDEFRSLLTPGVKTRLLKSNCDLVLQPLDVSVDKPFKALLRQGSADSDVQTSPDMSDEAIVALVVEVSPNDSDEDDMESDNTGG